MAKTDDAPAVPVTDATVLSMGRPERIQDSVLRQIGSFDDAVNEAARAHGTVADYAEEYGTGYDVTDKAQFTDKSILLLEWSFHSGTWGTFVSAVVMANDGTKGIINDGSTGLCEQLMEVSREGRYGGLMVRRGLTESEYPTCVGNDGNCGRPRPNDEEECRHCGDESERRSTGSTFYLDLRQS